MRVPKVFHNRLSYTGAAVAALAFGLFIFLLILHAVSGGAEAPYAGLIIFVFLPGVLLSGLVLIPIGMTLEWRRVRRTGVRSIPRFPILDLNDSRQRSTVAV